MERPTEARLRTHRTRHVALIPKAVKGSGLTVYVGDEKKLFTVHKDLICTFSAFFRKACMPPWKESEGVIHFTMTSPDTFELYVQWLYTSDSATLHDNKLTNMAEFENAYVLGDIVMDPYFKNVVMEALIKRVTKEAKYTLSLTSRIWRNTMPKSPLRAFYLDFIAYRSGTEWLDKKEGDAVRAPLEFWMDLSKHMLKVRANDARNNRVSGTDSLWWLSPRLREKYFEWPEK
ncbi:uncharacterized protein K452DRAFT_299113 [Aplosporella prunicola CBS 121167]|uniref:BTB domain-containing protein n=1 Tax=Aplosporella prunicola CBS 121167 TaxID=1176127 RepID=A0A6A6BCV8_9PEZI|nr:uncharacterized protein K452DRAFT_299113 [Aplosporella prunicola CBS 121167]KAF2141054.1 hypothetical protein K452DRAFT_299113 [Aplosporella prunicola CBS 121167]